MDVPYLWLTIIENPVLGNVTEWLGMGGNSNDGRNNFIAAIDSHAVKIAYYGPIGTNPNIFYYGVGMCEVVNTTPNILNRRDIISKQAFTSPDTYIFSNVTFSGRQNEHLSASGNQIAQVIESRLNPEIPVYPTLQEALNAMDDGIWDIPGDTVPITYITVNAIASGPNEESAGNDVSVTITPDNGYVIRNPSQGDSISVYNKNGYIPFNYTDGVLTFTVPDE